MQYAGFAKRFFAILLDVVILTPISIFILWIGSYSKDVHLAIIIPHTLLYFAYNIYMNANYGGTLGKLIIGIRIVNLNGSAIHYKEAFLRNIVDLGFGIVIVAMQAHTLFNISDSSYESLNWFKQSIFLNKNMPEIYGKIKTVNQIWIWSELIILLFNKKKRALHDFIAGTVVVDLKKIVDESSIDKKLDRITSKLDS